ncbi:MAG TPA: hemerythrin domain-containing protein [Polyangia bacterium]
MSAQHREVSALFEALAEAELALEKQDLLDTLADKLVIHAKIEERLFYPLLQERLAEDLVRVAMVEHLDVKRLLSDLMETSPNDDGFDAKVSILEQHVTTHVQEEERELFAAAHQVLSRDELLILADEMLALQDEMEGTDPRLEVADEIADHPVIS